MTSGDTPAPTHDANLVRAIGVAGLAASIVNVTIGGGIFRISGLDGVTGLLGPAAPVAYLACAVLMGLIVLCIAQAGSRVSLTGGPYAYVEATFGRYVGFLVGVLLWIIGATAIPGVATIFADAMARSFPAMDNLAGKALFLAVMFAIVTTINVRGVKQGTRLNIVFSIAKLVPLLLLLVAGLFAVNWANLAWTNGAPAASDVSRASILVIFIFAGVESALVPSGEVRDTARTVPRAVFLAMALITVIYIGLQVVVQGVVGPAIVGDAAPLATTASRVFGPWGGTMLQAGLMISAFGYLSGMMLAAPRALYAFGRDGILPKSFASVHPTFRTPWIAIITQAVLAWVLAITNSFETLVIIANVSAALVYLGCAAASWKLRNNPPADGATAGFRIPGGAAVPVLTVVGIAWLLSSVKLAEWRILGIVLLVASALFVIAERTRARTRTA